jgi:hypothetical protein
MKMLEWWRKVDPEVRAWLIAHNGEALDQNVIAGITAAGGDVTSNAWWIGEDNPTGIYLSDEAIDWIEAAANGE